MEEVNRLMKAVDELGDAAEDAVYSINLLTEILDTTPLREKASNSDSIHEKNKQEFRDFVKRKARR
jgi:hypothetical protein